MKQRAIWKFKLPIEHEFTLEAPFVATVINHLGVQGEDLYLWTEVMPFVGATLSKRHFRIFGTGQDYDDAGTYIDSIQCGPFVWHLFEVFP